MTSRLPRGWRRVRLGDVLQQVDRFEPVDPKKEHRLLGVRWYANGCHLRSSVRGHDLKTRRVGRGGQPPRPTGRFSASPNHGIDASFASRCDRKPIATLAEMLSSDRRASAWTSGTRLNATNSSEMAT